MDADRLYEEPTSLSDAEEGAPMVLAGASRRPVGDALLAAAAPPLLYRGITGHRPILGNGFTQLDSTRTALRGARGRTAMKFPDLVRAANKRDGMHRQAIHRGRASYEPKSLGGRCPFQAGAGAPEHHEERRHG